jgi:hypothetical protein
MGIAVLIKIDSLTVHWVGEGCHNLQIAEKQTSKTQKAGAVFEQRKMVDGDCDWLENCSSALGQGEHTLEYGEATPHIVRRDLLINFA